ncbi:alpha/beta fold hydrolase [Gelidibacter sp. F63206]|jgi:pimeloyl-ACP methyl ester carboxylesterase|uniref:alpha/beta fold hydrolase n=1 Tax=Gelidibacter sp. F63206 TaxID=2926425 RepID=UPI001FF293BE|nr:alpha/beta hydrolase [Gelidibacter sp. F63206]MCK0114902.1 alpha/beta hydrolase [Gelidibacter sp. F63206]
MKNSVKYLSTLLLLLLQFCDLTAQNKFDTPYGNNDSIGKYVELNGAKIYYEEYGNGEPLLLIHGNGANIKSMENQIEFFKSKYRVIIADNRGHGKSELKTDSLNYAQIANDWDGLVNHLKLDSVNILGWSDGGVIALKMGISKQSKIKKIVAMAANLRPDTTAVHSWAPNRIREDEKLAKEMIATGDTSRDWNLELQHYGLLLNQPNMSHEELKKISVPVLIVAGDRDIIKNEHSVEIFEQLSKGQLCIMAGSTHIAPKTKPEMFNEIVNRFLTEPFDYKPRK